MALSAVRGRITARWAGVAALILGVAAATATPAAAAGRPHAPGQAAPAFPAGVWQPADSPGIWGPLKAAAGSPAAHGLAAPPAGLAPPGGPWRLQRSPNPVIHNGMLVADSCTGRGICTAVGGYENHSGTQVPLAEARAGAGWRMQRTPVPAGAVLSSYGSSNGASVLLAETWNGTRWRIQATPSPAGSTGSEFLAVSCSAAAACTAVGVEAASDFSPPGAFAETWNGTRWRLQPVPVPAGTVLSELFGVSCPAPGSCTAVGDTAGQSMIGVTLAMTTAGS